MRTLEVGIKADARDMQLAMLRAEVDMLKLQLSVTEAVRGLTRFHAFDAIKDDRCPSCGGAVVVVETDREVTLRART